MKDKMTTLKFLYKNKWSHSSFRRFGNYRERSSYNRIDTLSEAGPSTSKQNSKFPGWRNVYGNSGQCKALATLTVNRALDREREQADARQMEIVKALREGDKTTASDLLQRHVQMTQSSRAVHFGHILEYCAQSTDPLFAMEIWRLIDDRKIRPNRYFFMLMIQTLSKAGYLEEGLNMLQYLGENRSLDLSIHAYNHFLIGSVKHENTVYASKCLDLMERGLVGKNERTYLGLLKLAVLQKNCDAVHEIWKDYVKHYPPNILLMRHFTLSYVELKDFKAAYEILLLMVISAVKGANFGVKTMNGRFNFPKVDIPIPLKHGLSFKTWAAGNVDDQNEELDGLVCGFRNIITQEDVSPIVNVFRSTFNGLISGCAEEPDCRLVEQLFQQMQDLGLEPLARAYDGLVKAVVEEKGFAAGMEVLETMQKRNLKPHIATLATIIRGCSKALKLDLAEALLNQLERCPHPYPYNALLKACWITNDLERAVRVLAKMKQAGAIPDIKTYERLLYLFGNVNYPYEKGNLSSQAIVAQRIKAIEADMAKYGVQHRSKSIRNLLRALGYEGMIKEVIRYLRVAEDLFARNNKYLGTPVYNTVLLALTAAEESHTAIEIFKSMRNSGLLLDDVTYNTMIDCCSLINCFRSATALVSLMIRDGYFPQTMSYTALLKILLDEENYDEALYLLDRACSDSDELDTLLFNTVLKKSGEKGRIDVLEFTIEHMRRANVGPDASTCSYVSATYSDQMRNRMTFEALQVLSVRMIIHEGVPTEEERSKYEDFIFSEDPEAESQIFHLFKDYEDNIAFALLNLRWCAILGFMDSVNWVPDESLWARRISTDYEELIRFDKEVGRDIGGNDGDIRNRRKAKIFTKYGSSVESTKQ